MPNHSSCRSHRRLRAAMVLALTTAMLMLTVGEARAVDWALPSWTQVQVMTQTAWYSLLHLLLLPLWDELGAREIVRRVAWIGGVIAVLAAVGWVASQRRAGASGASGATRLGRRVRKAVWKEMDSDTPENLDSSTWRLSSVNSAFGRMRTTVSDTKPHIRDSADAARRGTATMRDALDAIAATRDQAVQGNEHLQRFAASAKQLAPLVESLRECVDQANLLSLNTAVQAANAGELGRGFGAAAEELRRLSEQSARDAARIGDLARTMQTDATQAVNATQNAADNAVDGVQLGEQAAQAMNEIERAVRVLQNALDAALQDAGGQPGGKRNAARRVRRRRNVDGDVNVGGGNVNARGGDVNTRGDNVNARGVAGRSKATAGDARGAPKRRSRARYGIEKMDFAGRDRRRTARRATESSESNEPNESTDPNERREPPLR